jgi:hypothetical protein
MTTRTLGSGLTAALLLTTLASPAGAATATFTTFISKTMVTADDQYGGCMAALSVNPRSKLPKCAATWVTFDCRGKFATDPLLAYRLLDQAQLALAANKSVYVTVDDARIVNGVCFAPRLDVVK